MCLASVRTSLLIALAVLLSGCGAIRMDPDFDRDPAVEARILSAGGRDPLDVQLLELDASMRDFLSRHVPAGLSERQRLERLQELLFDEQYLNIRYRDSANYSAIGAFHAREANCLSLVNLFIAMARHLGLDARYHTVQIRPRWDMRGELLVLSDHINATGRIARNTRYVVDFTPDLSLQTLTAEVIPDAQAKALYFNNLGVEELIRQQYEAALEYFRNALWIAPELAIVWNNIGAAYNRMAETELAEYSYQRSFDIDQSSPTAINNLAKFYYAQEDFEKAAAYERAIRRFNNRNPYYHFMLGNVAYSEGSFDQALRHYTAALRRKELEPDFYYAMSQAYQALGEESQAEHMLNMAAYTLSISDQVYRPSQDKLRLLRDDGQLEPAGTSQARPELRRSFSR